MSDADGMPMPGAWTMSMAWMRTSEHTRLEAGAAFLAMWMVMMLAMMLPPAVLMLWSYRRCVRGSGAARLGRLTLLAGAGYFFVWAVFGVVAYALGAALAEAEMRWSPLARSVPLATGVILLLAGALQLTAWKIRQLARCADAPASDPSSAPMAWNAWRRGLRLGMRCSRCCAGLMLVLLVTDVMSLGAMAMVAGAITLERFVPRPQRAARVIGVLVIAAGVLAIARALPG
jgi:predicted metal-binding membrane protein